MSLNYPSSPIKKKRIDKKINFDDKGYVYISPHNITLDKILQTMPECNVITRNDIMWAKLSGLYNIIGNKNVNDTYNSILFYTNPSPVDDNLPYIKQIKEKYPNLENEIKIHALCAEKGKSAGKKLIENFINNAPKNTLIYLQPSETNLNFLEKYYTKIVQPRVKNIDPDFIYK